MGLNRAKCGEAGPRVDLVMCSNINPSVPFRMESSGAACQYHIKGVEHLWDGYAMS